MLDHHVDGYLQNGISINDNDVVFDVGANVGVFGLRAIQKAKNVNAYCFEPIPDIFSVLKKNAEEYGDNRIHVYEFGVSDKLANASFTYFPNTPALSTLARSSSRWCWFARIVSLLCSLMNPKYMPFSSSKMSTFWKCRGAASENGIDS